MKGKPYIFVGAAVAILIALWLIFFTQRKDDSTIVVVLEAHAGDAEKALGAFIDVAEHTVVVKTFFTDAISHEAPGTTTDPELLQDTTKDIQAVLAAYSDKKIEVYAPAIYNETIGNKDQALLHEGFVDAVRNYPEDASAINFYFYEDSEYTAAFNRVSVGSLMKNLEEKTEFVLEKITLEPSKIIVYKIFRI
jgi:hypothetical protein